MNRVFKNNLKKTETPKSNNILVWTGPRATDIIDCETGLFDGSITLYGCEYPDEANTKSDNTNYDDFYVRLSRQGDAESIGFSKVREDKNGRYYAPNRCFCDSKYNLEGKEHVINHNRSDLKEGDLYILTQQILLMAEREQCDVYFMSYNQNFVGRHGSEDQYLLLASLLVCERECDIESDAQNNHFNRCYDRCYRDNDLFKCIEYINVLYKMKRGEIKEAVMAEAFEYVKRMVEGIEKSKTCEEPKAQYDGSNRTKKAQPVTVCGNLLDNRFDSSFFNDFKKQWDNSQSKDNLLCKLIDNLCDILGFVLKVRGFKKSLGSIDDIKRKKYVESILNVWINSLNFETICKIARLFYALYSINDKGELDRLDKCLLTLVKKHLGRDYKNLNLGNSERASDSNIVWMMKYLSEIIVCHMVCLNSNEYLMKVLDSKEGFRKFCKSHEIPTTESIIIKENGENCSLNVFRNYIRCDKFVVQKNHSSGGFGTYLYENPKPFDEEVKNNPNYNYSINKDSTDEGLDKRTINQRIASDLKGCTSGDLIISKYRDPSISLNIHCLISEREILYSPGSVQIILNTNGRLMYSGADFIAFEQYKKEKPGDVENIMQYVSWICGSLRGYGYRGIIGFDIIVSEEYRIEFVEANNRFQASTCLLNKRMRNMMFESGNNGHINRRYDLKPISCNYRFPSMQLLNLMCFKSEDLYSYDGEDKNEIENRSESYNRLIKEYAGRFCPECLDGDSLFKLPVLNSELEKMIVPYSMFIFYNSGPFENDNVNNRPDDFKRVTINGKDHYRMIHECMEEIKEDENEEYNWEKRRINNQVIVDVGSFLHNNNSINNGINIPMINNLEFKSHLLNDGISTRYYQDAMKCFKGILGSFIAARSNQDTIIKCKDVLNSLSALIYSDYSPTCDQICFICDTLDYYQETKHQNKLNDNNIEGFIKEQEEHWNNFYKSRSDYLDKLLLTIQNGLIKDKTPYVLMDLFTKLDAISGKNCKKPLPADVLEIRERTIREFLDITSRFAATWVKILNTGSREYETVIEWFNKGLDKILVILYLKEKELTDISRKKVELMCKNMISTLKGNNNALGVEELNKALDKKTEEANNLGYDSENLSKIDIKKSISSNLGIISDAYDNIIKNPVRKIQLCRIFDGENEGTNNKHYENDAFITKVIFYNNICSTNLGKVVVHPNIMPPDRTWNRRILSTHGAEYLALKISLINNGIRLDKSMKDRFKARPGVNSSVDLIIKCKDYLDYGVLENETPVTRSELPINCAYNNSISIFSPYKLQILDEKVNPKTFTIKYYDRLIMINLTDSVSSPLEVGFYHEKDDIAGLTATNKIPKTSIAFLATDRLRLQHNDGCIFASKGRGCKFCEFTVKDTKNRLVSFEEEDILEVVREVMENHDFYNNSNYVWSTGECVDRSHTGNEKRFFNHVLIGGGTLSNEGHISRDRITKIAKEIVKIEKERLARQNMSYEDHPLNIYLMCIPPEDLEDLRVWKEAGITEIAFNMEVYNRSVARKIMPEKSRISRSTYLSALIRAVETWETRGAVRSALILGLEKEKSTIEGVAMLTSLGVEPILSIFRPVKGTELSYVMPLESPILYKIYKEAQSLCEQASLRLGPDCIHCQNNTLSLPKELDYGFNN